MSEKIALISLGCPKNLINSEQMLFLLAEAGYTLVPDPDGADVAVVNTCGFIDSAKSEAIDVILSLAALKEAGQLQRIVVCGCLSQRYREELRAELPEVDAIVGVGSFSEIVAAVRGALAGEKPELFGDINAPVDETGRAVSTGPGWAYVKIADGCDNRCAFCAIPSIRGRYRSRPMEAIVEECRSLAQSGVREVILVAQDITRYGTDLKPKNSLAALCRELVKIEGLEWLRLHYLYPDRFDDELIECIASEPKIVKYLDIPLQHINDTILRRMNRRGTGAEIRTLLKKLRERIPSVVIRTSLITGLPGETLTEFEELCTWLREAKLERAGVFPFSPEEGTAAAEMTDRVDEEEAQRRAQLVMDLQAEVMDDWCRAQLGKTLRVLVQGYDEEADLLWGRSWADSPEIDGRVLFDGEAEPGCFADIQINAVTEDGDLVGVLV